MAVRTSAPINQLFNDESSTHYIFGCLYVELVMDAMEKQDYLVMARNFKDIL